ncbi:VOC family protein [Actinomadura viridis]|uniref:Glyoxalase superfamily protein PhnB n=1 Tax=Actinomadura viridis TaxID=58110 RepID=A0A931DIW2_9ACTN|nr:VOC family protein [Actinomadura viridis]MBG6088992.1 putative glyoxalase superfamily protein PhnB [Actinomadura viridis]
MTREDGMTATPRNTFYPLVKYRDPAKAMDWLEQAFGFVPLAAHKDDDGRVVHAEMRYDTGIVMFGAGEPGGPGVYVAVDDPDAHHDRAREAGAEIFRGLSDQSYGSRDYAARDPEGNEWYFGTYRP